MTQIAFRGREEAFDLELGSALRMGADEDLFELCARNPELRIERSRDGNLIVMTLSGWESSHRNLKIAAALERWASADGTGIASGSSAGFVPPNGAVRSPDAAWVLGSRVRAVPPETRKRFLPLCPDFVVELRSPTDRLGDLRAKMEEYRDEGARLGWLIDPEERRVHVYRPGREVVVLDEPDELSGDPELPGFVLDLAPVWALL